MEISRREFIKRLAASGLTAGAAGALFNVLACGPRTGVTPGGPTPPESTVPAAPSSQALTSTFSSLTIPSAGPSSATGLNKTLPAAIPSGNSVELCLNSRYSIHNLAGTATDQQAANVLWAAGRVPPAGSYRKINISTPSGTYQYDPLTHALSGQSAQPVAGGALLMNCDAELAFDAGVSYMLAILAAVSLWKSTESPVASCPKMTSLYLGVQSVRGFTTELVAKCSRPQGDPGWLPDPSTDGHNKLEEVMADLKYVSRFNQSDLTIGQISQLLWAGYGCNAHVTEVGGRKGLTVPSAIANYYLTGSIYLVNATGVCRYHNRNPAGDLTTRDHRLEPLSAGDVRRSLAATVNALPQAPCYVLICLAKTKIVSAQDTTWARLETGFVAGNVLVQASALGLGCSFTTAFTTDEQAGIQVAAGTPASELPQAILSLGAPAG